MMYGETHLQPGNGSEDYLLAEWRDSLVEFRLKKSPDDALMIESNNLLKERLCTQAAKK